MARIRKSAAAESLAAAFESLAAGVPGHTAVTASVDQDEDGKAVIVVTAMGWGSTLNRRRLITRHQLHTSDPAVPGQPDPRHVSLAAAKLAPRLAVQASRHAAALHHGLAARSGAALDPTAMLIDRTLARLLSERGVKLGHVVGWHRGQSTEQPDAHGSMSKIDYHSRSRTRVHLEPGTTTPVLDMEIELAGAPHRTRYSGDILTIEAALPATLLIAAVGRRLGALIGTRIATLDDRIVEDVADSPEGVRILLRPDRVTIAEASAETPLRLQGGRP